MPSITVHGASDDLVEVDGCPGGDEFQVYGGYFEGDLIAPGGAVLHITVSFTDSGDGWAWKVTTGPVDDDIPAPDWPIERSHRPSYEDDDLVTIDAPPGTRLDNVVIA
jgi:hypothetical protein